MSNYKKIVVTGASGFLGRHLLERLKESESYKVFALSSHPDVLKDQIGGSRVVYLEKDAVQGATECLRGALVIHCAYPRNATGAAVAGGLKYIQNVFESAAESKAEAIINISSQSIYSQQRTETATEETAISLESPYAVGKYAVELLLESICNRTGTYYTNLRLASLIGPGFDQRIVNRFIRNMLNYEPVKVVIQEKKMGFLDVEDAVSAIMALICCPPQVWKPVYNVGTGQGYTVEEIYEAIVSKLKGRMDLIEAVKEFGTDASSSAVSFELLHQDTGFVPRIDLGESIDKILVQM